MKLLADPELIRSEIDRRGRELRAQNPLTTQKSKLQLELSRCSRTVSRLVEAYQEELVSLEELRERIPSLRKRQSTLRSQLDALEAETLDRQTYVALAETLESFLRRLRDSADTSSTEARQRVIRLLVKEVLVDPERIVIRHSIPTRRADPGKSYPLCGRSH
jgi:site-specific DNA recombinase